jgi:hypothetical protein
MQEGVTLGYGLVYMMFGAELHLVAQCCLAPRARRRVSMNLTVGALHEVDLEVSRCICLLQKS